MKQHIDIEQIKENTFVRIVHQFIVTSSPKRYNNLSLTKLSTLFIQRQTNLTIFIN